MGDDETGTESADDVVAADDKGEGDTDDNDAEDETGGGTRDDDTTRAAAETSPEFLPFLFSKKRSAGKKL